MIAMLDLTTGRQGGLPVRKLIAARISRRVARRRHCLTIAMRATIIATIACLSSGPSRSSVGVVLMEATVARQRRRVDRKSYELQGGCSWQWSPRRRQELFPRPHLPRSCHAADCRYALGGGLRPNQTEYQK